MSHQIDAESPTEARAARTRRFWRWIGLTGGLSLLIAGIFLIDRVMDARDAAQVTSCQCNMCFIGLAFHNFQDAESVLPMAIVSKVPVSWRVRLLPYASEFELSAAYDKNSTWDAEVNRPISSTVQRSYECPTLPNHRNAAGQGLTSYAMLNGEDCFSSAAKLSDVTDGLSHTLAVVEASGRHIPWAEPRDVDTKQLQPGFERWHANQTAKTWLSSTHRRGAVVSYADGRSGIMSPKIDPIVLRQLATIAGGEKRPPGFLDE